MKKRPGERPLFTLKTFRRPGRFAFSVGARMSLSDLNDEVQSM